MKALLQRVKKASVSVNGQVVSSINQGLLIFLGVEKNDTQENADYLAKKSANLRIFEDENQKMNKSISQIDGEMLVISNFTLYANTTHGFRPDFINSMMPQRAEEYVNKFVEECRKTNCFKKIKTGIFGADMKVCVENDGPVTIIIESEKAK